MLSRIATRFRTDAGFFRGLTRKQAVSELAQIATIALIESLPTWNGKVKQLRPYVHAVARHAMLKHVERERRRGRDTESLKNEAVAREAAAVTAPLADIQTHELTGAIGDAMQALPALDRRVVEMIAIDGYSQKEVADEFGLSQQHVSRIYNAGKQAICDAMSKTT
jgi:RNA polymerase sigma factor (sigma-70 family)